MFQSDCAMAEGGMTVKFGMTPRRQRISSSATAPTMRSGACKQHLHPCPIARSDSPRSSFQIRLVILPNDSLATMVRVALARPAGGDDVEKAPGTRGHHADPVGEHRRFVQRVGDQQHRGAGLAPQAQQLVAHQQARLLVERAERLVEQDEARLEHQRARDAHALAHAAGELRRVGAREFLQAHELDGVADLRGTSASAAPARRRPKAMLSYTVSHGKLASSWNTTPTPSGTSPFTGFPSNEICPAEAGARPAITSSRVDLPQPEGPTTAKNSPCASSRSIGPSACTALLPG